MTNSCVTFEEKARWCIMILGTSAAGYVRHPNSEGIA